MGKTMTATLPPDRVSNGKNYGDSKEMTACASVVAIDNAGDLVDPITARWYMARRSDGASPVYCSVWIGGNGHTASGHGSASGYGYHKRSAAMQAAIDSAGIKLSEPIDGRGDSAQRDALSAIARAMGYTAFTIIEH